MNNYHHVLVDAKNEYTKQLMMVLTIPILEEYNNTNDAKLEIKRFKES